MIIKGKPLNTFLFKCCTALIGFVLKIKLNKIVIDQIEIKPNHSYLLMCNHFGFADGFLAFYLCRKILFGKNKMKRLHIMSLKKQMLKNSWLKYIGSFSVDPKRRSMTESFDYAAQILSEPGNVLLFYPQGNLESNHVRQINFEYGINEIVPKIKGNCQLIWSSNLIEYFESINPSLYYNMLDCGTNLDYDFESLVRKVNDHHRKSIFKNFRFTQED